MSNTFPIEELRSLLDKARATDANLKQFGAEKHKYQWNSPACIKEVEKFERETAEPDFPGFIGGFPGFHMRDFG